MLKTFPVDTISKFFKALCHVQYDLLEENWREFVSRKGKHLGTFSGVREDIEVEVLRTGKKYEGIELHSSTWQNVWHIVSCQYIL